MPIYEYRCESCGHELEKLQRMSDDKLTDCPECGESKLKRLISAAGFRLKGAGWYETDFKQSNQRNLADSSEKPGKGAGSGAAVNGGDKPAATKSDTAAKSSKTDSASKSSSSSGGGSGSSSTVKTA